MRKLVLVLALCAVALMAPAQAKGRSHAVTAPDTLTLVGAPTFGNVVTFSFATTASEPYVVNECFQGETLVLYESHIMVAGIGFGQDFMLGPTDAWTGGDGDCTANLYDYAVYQGDAGQQIVLVTTSFHVSAP